MFDMLLNRLRVPMPLRITDADEASSNQPFELVDSDETVPEETIDNDNVWYQYIDDAVLNSSADTFTLHRLPYLMSDADDQTIPLSINRYSDRIVVRFNGNVYEWYPRRNVILGNSDDILRHFNNKPDFMRC